MDEEDFYEEDYPMTHAQQSHSDRSSAAQERLERGEICPIQAAEIAAGC
jgi:hypothetical protein|tara:strand:- start:223 stop:369 length:147 start_codon:yes stop_codon:yes gene_type:complete